MQAASTVRVWVQVRRGGVDVGRPDKVIVNAASDVADVCDAVLVKYGPLLQGEAAASLIVSTSSEAGDVAAHLDLELTVDDFPKTSSKAPLYVHAPGAPATTAAAAGPTKPDAQVNCRHPPSAVLEPVRYRWRDVT